MRERIEEIRTEDDFWAKITNKAMSDIHRLYLILSARGFELKYENNSISVVNYNGYNDRQYLAYLLEENGVGYPRPNGF